MRGPFRSTVHKLPSRVFPRFYQVTSRAPSKPVETGQGSPQKTGVFGSPQNALENLSSEFSKFQKPGREQKKQNNINGTWFSGSKSCSGSKISSPSFDLTAMSDVKNDWLPTKKNEECCVLPKKQGGHPKLNKNYVIESTHPLICLQI